MKVVHTVAWAFFAGCIFAIPVFAWRGQFIGAVVLIAIVFGEVVVIVANKWRCPLTGVAAQYTDDRRDNFDIHLPAGDFALTRVLAITSPDNTPSIRLLERLGFAFERLMPLSEGQSEVKLFARPSPPPGR